MRRSNLTIPLPPLRGWCRSLISVAPARLVRAGSHNCERLSRRVGRTRDYARLDPRRPRCSPRQPFDLPKFNSSRLCPGARPYSGAWDWVGGCTRGSGKLGLNLC